LGENYTNSRSLSLPNQTQRRKGQSLIKKKERVGTDTYIGDTGKTALVGSRKGRTKGQVAGVKRPDSYQKGFSIYLSVSRKRGEVIEDKCLSR